MRSVFVTFIYSGLWVFALVLAGCSNQSKKSLDDLSEQKLYETAQNHLKNRRYLLAIEALQELEADYPFGKYANSAQLALIYAWYRSNELALVTAAANRYIRLHPNHPNVDYAWYMRALAAFPRNSDLFQRTLGTDLSLRDVKSARTAFVQFSDLVSRFPDSDYAPDAIKRMEYLRNLLARAEVQAGNYYMEREAYVAAANRARHVLENYQLSTAIPDALALLVQSYHYLGMDSLATDSLKILALNYPDYPALNDDGSFNYNYYREGTGSLIGTLTFGLIDRSKAPGFDTRKQYGGF